MKRLLLPFVAFLGLFSLHGQDSLSVRKTDSITFARWFENYRLEVKEDLQNQGFLVDLKETKSQLSKMPQLYGSIRAKFEWATENNQLMFQLRNARIGLRGAMGPYIDYKAEVDLSDAGSFSLKDIFIRYNYKQEHYFAIGHLKIPFGLDIMRSINQYYFSNRSFVSKQIVSRSRELGFTYTYLNRGKVPFEITAGILNSTGWESQSWQPGITYSLHTTFKPLRNFFISASAKSSQETPTVRSCMADIASYFDYKGWHIEGEVIYKTYSDSVTMGGVRYKAQPTWAYQLYTSYDIQIPKKCALTKITPLIRYDYMSDNYRFDVDNDVYITKFNQERHRITAGLTFSFGAPFLADIQLNYEKYFYENRATISMTDLDVDKVSIQCVLRF